MMGLSELLLLHLADESDVQKLLKMCCLGLVGRRSYPCYTRGHLAADSPLANFVKCRLGL